MTKTSYYLISFDLRNGRPKVRRFTNEGNAMRAYDDMEQAHKDDPDKEVVLVAANSLETVKRTHSHYFAREKRRQFHVASEGRRWSIRTSGTKKALRFYDTQSEAVGRARDLAIRQGGEVVIHDHDSLLIDPFQPQASASRRK